MGQRSQIYIRYNVNYISGALSESPKTENYKGLIARYFQWNYGERMISRARYTIEKTQDYLVHKFMFGLEYQLEKLRRFCDVNFDMKDIATSCDIIEEWKEISPEENFNDRVFKGQDNNDGQLYIDITNYGIKYCFTKYCADGEPMDAEQYMEWDYQDSKYLNWRIPCEYMSQETIDYTEENIKIIKDMATLMTKEELAAFINDDYSYLYTS